MQKSIVVLVTSSVLLFGCTTSRQAKSTARFQVSAWAYGTQTSAEHGYYIIDTWTGEVWANGWPRAKKVSEAIIKVAESEGATQPQNPPNR